MSTECNSLQLQLTFRLRGFKRGKQEKGGGGDTRAAAPNGSRRLRDHIARYRDQIFRVRLLANEGGDWQPTLPRARRS